VRATLAHFDEAQRVEYCDDLARSENRDTRHLFHNNGLSADELGIEFWFAVIEQHCNHFL
jgi:hypothetical protein